MSAVSRDGQRVSYEVVGRGARTVICAHGWGLDSSIFYAAADALAGRYRFVLVDLPGHGRSGTTRAAWTVEAYAEDLAAVVDELRVTEPILVGHSMAGRVVLEAAVGCLRGRAAGCVLIDSLPDARAAAAGGAEAFAAMRADLLRDHAGAIHRIVAGMSPAAEVTRALAGVEVTIARLPLERALAILEENLRYPIARTLASYAELERPLWSINSDLVPTADAANRALVPGWQTRIVPGASHWLMIDQPAAFSAALGEVLAALSSPSDANGDAAAEGLAGR